MGDIVNVNKIFKLGHWHTADTVIDVCTEVALDTVKKFLLMITITKIAN